MKERVEKLISVREGGNLPEPKAIKERSKLLLQGRKDSGHKPQS